MVATSREMLFNANGLVVNAYHDAAGRQNYFPGSAGTSEGQFAMITGCLRAYQVTGDVLGKRLGELALSGVLKTLYRNAPIPDVVAQKEIFAPHWLFNVKYDFTATTIHLYEKFNFVNGVATIPDPLNQLRYTFHIRSEDSVLLWDNPYSSLSAGEFFPIASTVFIEDVGVQITSTENINGLAYIAYSKLDGQLIEPNDPFEAWPDWRALDRGEIDCAVDTLVWAEHAYNLAYQVFGNPVWQAAARATREQAVQAFDINDSRDWIKPSWSDDPFSVGSSFSFSNRVPSPVFSRDETGRILVTVPKGNGEVQYGNASRLDTYKAGDTTTVIIGSSKPVEVTIYIDKFQTVTDNDRYQKTLQLTGKGMQTFTLTNADFVSKGSGATLATGSPVYTVGVITKANQAHEITIERIRQLPPLDVKYYPGAIPFTANFLGSPAQLIDWRGPVYAGYQSPDMWVTIGNQAAASTCVDLLDDAQTAFLARTGGSLRGPFAPVFFFNRADAVQYGPPDTFGWEGPDPNTKWGGYQYRPLVELAKASWVLNEPARSKAIGCVTDFLHFLADNTVWVPGQAAPSDFPPDAPLGQALYKEPHFAALILRAIIYLDIELRPNGAGVMTADSVTVMNKCWTLLQDMWITSGVMRGTFSGQPAIHEWYGFHHAEILTTLSELIEWAEGYGNQPAMAVTARSWIKDMLRWARANVYVPPSEYGEVLWSPTVNWVDGLQETFTYRTEVVRSFSGKEQRRSLRELPRRSLQFRHTMAVEESQAFDELIRRYQNNPVLVPQWHLAQRLDVAAVAGDTQIVLTGDASEYIEWGGFVTLATTGRTALVQVENFDGAVVYLVEPLTQDWPSGTRLAPAMRGLMSTDLTSQRVTAGVAQADVSFDMLPQEDRRTLPDLPALASFTVNGDTREVIAFRHNWADGVQLRDNWGYELISYAEGPVTPLSGENQGARTLTLKLTFFSAPQIEEFRGLLKRLQGQRVAAWLPSGIMDLQVVQQIEMGDSLYVAPGPRVTNRLVNDPALALCVRTTSGQLLCARVVQVINQPGGTVLLKLDRAFAQAVSLSEIAMVNLMYRVRQASDAATIKWLTDDKAAAQIDFTTVFDETTL